MYLHSRCTKRVNQSGANLVHFVAKENVSDLTRTYIFKQCVSKGKDIEEHIEVIEDEEVGITLKNDTKNSLWKLRISQNIRSSKNFYTYERDLVGSKRHF